MPSAIQGSAGRPNQGRPPATYVVKSGDSLSAIAGRLLGDSKRWSEIYALNRDLIGSNPNQIRAGMTLKLPGGVPAPVQPVNPPAAAPTASKPAPKTEKPEPDRYAPGPQRDTKQQWTQQTADEFAAFVDKQTDKLRAQGAEIDCADFAVKLLKDFCEQKGIPNPMEGKGTWHRYTPERSGGLPNVNGPTYHLAGIHADNLAKGYTKRVNDADGDGIRGYDPSTGKIDVSDLRAGDLLFYDWDGNGIVNHTVNVLGVADDGTVTLAFGTYDNTRPGEPLRWENLDFKPIERLELKPGSEDYQRWLGEGNGLYAVRRYNWMPDHAAKPLQPLAAPASATGKAAMGLASGSTAAGATAVTGMVTADPAPDDMGAEDMISLDPAASASAAPADAPTPSGLDHLLRILRGE